MIMVNQEDVERRLANVEKILKKLIKPFEMFTGNRVYFRDKHGVIVYTETCDKHYDEIVENDKKVLKLFMKQEKEYLKRFGL